MKRNKNKSNEGTDFFCVEHVRTAGVGPHVGESDLFRGALLEQEAVFGVEQEDGECAVQKTLINVAHQVACRNHPWISNCS